MINCYRGAMDTNLVIPRGLDKTDVIFDFYFADVSGDARPQNLASIEVSEQIQDEDVAICVSVQRGLRSRAYDTGRLSVRREAGRAFVPSTAARGSSGWFGRPLTFDLTDRPKSRLLPVLGLGFGVAVTIGNTIGAGIFRTPGEVAAHLPSPVSSSPRGSRAASTRFSVGCRSPNSER
jgi:hypothetical protein